MISIIIPIYSSPFMLAMQLAEFELYPPGIEIILIDDGSPEPVVIPPMPNVSLYRIDVDIPWNNHGARNLGAFVANTEWLLMMDVDHILPARCANLLLEKHLLHSVTYKFVRYRIFNDRREQIRPAPNVFVCAKTTFLQAGGYDEDYSGSYGGDMAFLEHMPEARTLLPDIYLDVYTNETVVNASTPLSRDLTRYNQLRAVKGSEKASNPIRFPWHKVMP